MSKIMEWLRRGQISKMLKYILSLGSAVPDKEIIMNLHPGTRDEKDCHPLTGEDMNQMDKLYKNFKSSNPKKCGKEPSMETLREMDSDYLTRLLSMDLIFE